MSLMSDIVPKEVRDAVFLMHLEKLVGTGWA